MSKVHEMRANKDFFFENDPGSPLTASQKTAFSGLEYFRVDSSYRVLAAITEFSQQRTITLGTSNGGQSHFWRYGWAKFELKGKKECVTLYIPVDANAANTFFIPFSDETNGKQTYGGGRYLDVPRENNEEIVLDFNMAYNPYCAYNSRWNCVLPPVENLVEQAVRAGERVYPFEE